MKEQFCKAYDFRGEYGKDFNLKDVYRLGWFLSRILRERCGAPTNRPLRILVGRDARKSSKEIQDKLCEGLADAGCEVDFLDVTTTPSVYFLTATGKYDGSVQITASHNPSKDNGMKVSCYGGKPVSKDGGLEDLTALVNSKEKTKKCKTPKKPNRVTCKKEFVAWLRKWAGDFSNLRIAVDCLNGATGTLARDLFGKDTIYLNTKANGDFPCVAPNPLYEDCRRNMVNLVLKKGLDAGLIFDGDGDRVGFIDETGDFIQPDLMIPIIAQFFLKKEPNAKVIYDVRTSRGIEDALKAAGAKVVMGKVGHVHAKDLLRKKKAVCGGELAGHYYFRDFFHCDSAELAALLILNAIAEAKRKKISFSKMMAPIREYANSGECNFCVSDKKKATAAMLEAAAKTFGKPKKSLEIDGIRLDYDEGWFCIRESNTEPYLRLIVETRTMTLFSKYMLPLVKALAPFILPDPKH